MAKPTITTRAGKGSALTWTEGDTNLTNLRDATITVKADTGGTDVVSDLNSTVTLVAGTNVTITGDNTAKTVTINSTASGGATTLDGLTDVVITAAATNDVLVYNGTNWVDTAANTLTVSAASTATTATGATNINISTTTGNTSDTTLYPVLVGAASTGNQLPHIDSALTYNASTDTLTATTFSGSLSGNASTVTVTANNSTAATYYPMFATAATGSLSPNTDTGFTYNPSTGLLTTVGVTSSGTITSTGATAQLVATGLGVTLSPTGVSGVDISPTQGLLISPTTTGNIYNCTIGSSLPAAGTFTSLTSTGLTTLKTYKETVYAGGSQTTAYTPNYSNGTVHTVTMGGNVTFAAPTNMVAGNSLTLILTQDATGSRTGTWNASYKWAGGTPTLSTTATAIDIVNIFYDGTNYLTSISKQDNSSTVTGLQINAAGELRLADSDSSNYVGFKSPATVSTNKIWTLPSADGTSGQALVTDGAGALSWATAGGGNNIIVLSPGNGTGITFGATANTNMTNNWTLHSTGGISGVSVSTNTFTLPAGTYQIVFPFTTSQNASKGDWHLRNTTDSTTTASFSYNTFTLGGLSVGMYGQCTYNFTIAASKTYTLRTTSAVTGGWGLESGHWSAGYTVQIIKTA